MPLLPLLVLLACSDPSGAPESASPHAHDSADTDASAVPFPVRVRVTLDGAPAPGTLVLQGGGTERWTTDAEGRATVRFDPTVVGDAMIVAAHPDARVDGVEVDGPADEELVIALVRFDPRDNPLYTFASPGAGDLSTTTTAECGHCHPTLHGDWWDSPHRTSASNPVVQDVYAGTARAWADAETCATAGGGVWGPARTPGTGAADEACRVGPSVQEATGTNGGCADCHAPGIDGELGGRDLLDATGTAYEAGVHCDVCHHVAEVDMDAAPGVAGRLHVVRPSEPGSPSLGLWQPLSFGPLPDVVNPRMGAVHREATFHDADLCGACHELRAPAADTTRWPGGEIPVHTTYDEWRASPFGTPGSEVPCQSCHMPPHPEVGNAADLYNVYDDVRVGITGGWERLPGAVRGHNWFGPRQRASGMLELAALLQVRPRRDGDTVDVDVDVSNIGPGHALPTGEPLRQVILRVEATCDGRALAATGGDALADVAGARALRTAGEDWTRWPEARPGDVIRVVRRTGLWRDDPGWGPFGDGTFTGAAKGLPDEQVVGSAVVRAVTEDGAVTLDGVLPDGDAAWLGEAAALPDDGVTSPAVAGAPGRVFARVTVGADGSRQGPSFLAVDVASDNRLPPGAVNRSSYRFDARGCTGAVETRAVLVHRAYPWSLARARGWTLTESVMADVRAAAP